MGGRQLTVRKALNKKLAKEKELKNEKKEKDQRNLYLAKVICCLMFDKLGYN